MNEPAGRSNQASPQTIWPWAVVALAAILPYVVNLNDYFVRDDFGVVQLLAQKPFTYFPRWFVTSWMDHIWGYYPDEIRPFPAISYQITALGGTGVLAILDPRVRTMGYGRRFLASLPPAPLTHDLDAVARFFM